MFYWDLIMLVKIIENTKYPSLMYRICVYVMIKNKKMHSLSRCLQSFLLLTIPKNARFCIAEVCID